MDSTTIAVGFVVAGILVSLAMILFFLRYVYDRGGPAHVRAAAKALREVYDPSWPCKILGYLPTAEPTDSIDEEDIV